MADKFDDIHALIDKFWETRRREDRRRRVVVGLGFFVWIMVLWFITSFIEV